MVKARTSTREKIARITSVSMIPFFSLMLSVFAFTGCEQKKSEINPAISVSSVADVENNLVKTNPSPCGLAPSGDLVAHRIPGANSARKEFSLYEGPVWIKDALYFSDFTMGAGFPSRIQKLNTAGVMSTFIADSGSNGLAVDAQGNIVAATHKYKSLSRYTLTGERTNVVGEYEDNVFNSPNDLVIANDGTIYFTDPEFQRDAAPGGQDKMRVYRLGNDGVVTVVDDTIINPNGIALSNSGNVLYVSGGGEHGFIRAYPIINSIPQAGNNLINDITSPDGMAIDCRDNIYVTEHSVHRVRVFTPEGSQIATINVDANITNAAFGGVEGKTLFLTGAGAVWKIDLDVTGLPY